METEADQDGPAPTIIAGILISHTMAGRRRLSAWCLRMTAARTVPLLKRGRVKPRHEGATGRRMRLCPNLRLVSPLKRGSLECEIVAQNIK
jgi:hypothetical protein